MSQGLRVKGKYKLDTNYLGKEERMTTLIDSEKFRLLQETATMTVGYILGKEGIDAMPIYPLSKALLETGVESSHLRNIVKHHENKISIASPILTPVK